jgi:tetratricopeptide (TPR) repeat protein
MRFFVASILLLTAVPAFAGAQQRSAARQARMHLAAAEKAEALGDPALAILELKAAYFRDPRPETLFELAEVCRRAGDFERAAFFYRRYQSYASPERREQIERIARLVEAAVERARALRDAGPTETLAMPASLDD